MTALHGKILTPSGFVTGTVEVEDGRIVAVRPGPAPDRLVLPGFVDTHVHGGGGGDTMDGPGGVRTLARFHVRHGTTTLLPTTMTNPWDRVLAALRGVAEVCAAGVEGGPDLPGAHLEGPFISPKRLGAQPPNAVLPEPALVDEVLALGVVRVVTLAPELPGAVEAARRFAAAGVRVSLGHTAGAHEDALAVLAAVRGAGGTLGGTHLYNAMGGLAGREPGVLGALLGEEDAHAELILDLQHVHPGAFRVARAAKPGRLHLITDAIRAAGMPEGESELGGQKVFVRGGRASLPDGTLAGSVLTLDVALRNAVGAGASLEEASAMLSGVPARYLGLADRGEIAPGRRADLVVLDGDLNVREVHVAGERVV